MYAYFYIDKNDNLVECDRDTYKEWEFWLEKKWDDISFFYIKDRKVCVECPNSELYDRLEDKYGNGTVVMHSEFSVLKYETQENKKYNIVTSLDDADCAEDDDDRHRGGGGYYPIFETRVECYDGYSVKFTNCPNYGLEKAIEYHESIVLDIVSGKDLKYIS